MHNIFITGGTGFMGRTLIPRLLGRGHTVRALVRPGSERKLPAGCEAIAGDALQKNSFAAAIPPSDTFVQLVGVTHPNPSKGSEFRAVDLGSATAAISAAHEANIRHFVYVSVAHPAPMMKSYIAVRTEGERMIRESGLNASILRPWYVLGPGRRWPLMLVPFYWVFEHLPPTRESARRLGLVTLDQMIATLISAIESPLEGVRIFGVPEIRGAKI